MPLGHLTELPHRHLLQVDSIVERRRVELISIHLV